MTPSQGAELAVALLCLAVFTSYHVWIFCCDTHIKGYVKVMMAARNARRVWARSIAADDKETVTGWALHPALRDRMQVEAPLHAFRRR